MWKGLTRTMATGTIRPNAALLPLPFSNRVVPVNTAPRDFDPERDLPEGFPDFLASLHAALTLRQRALVAPRKRSGRSTRGEAAFLPAAVGCDGEFVEDRTAGLVRGPAQSNDGSGRRRGTCGKNAKFPQRRARCWTWRI